MTTRLSPINRGNFNLYELSHDRFIQPIRNSNESGFVNNLSRNEKDKIWKPGRWSGPHGGYLCAYDYGSYLPGRDLAHQRYSNPPTIPKALQKFFAGSFNVTMNKGAEELVDAAETAMNRSAR